MGGADGNDKEDDVEDKDGSATWFMGTEHTIGA